ncbi:transposable element Tcb1 transposase [Trichonephila clavipes]|nr:transposable element Tcb1 transposase [Trichonephila clavipes]
MTIAFVCGDPVVNASILPLFTAIHRSHSWCDGMGCHCLQYTVSPLVLIRGTKTAQRYVHDILQPQVLPLMQRLPGAIFQQDNALGLIQQGCHKAVSALFLPFLCLPDSRFVFNRAHLGSFGMVSWASHKFE